MTDNKSDDITNSMIMNAIHDVKLDIRGIKQGMNAVENRLETVESKLDSHSHQFNKINTALQRLYDRRVEMVVRIDKLEERVGIA